MPADFEAIERYIDFCKDLPSEEEDNFDMDVLSDQKVPQGVGMSSNEDVMFPNMLSEKQFMYNMNCVMDIGDFAPLHNSTTPIHVADTTQDQRVYGADSPKSFMDLDHVDNVSGQEVSFYEQSNIKEEKTFSPCSNTDNNSVTLSPHFDYNTGSDIHPILPPEQLDYSSIKEEYDELNFIPEDLDFGQTVVLALKKEINYICHILDILSDPAAWSPEDVHKWIVWHGSQFNATSEITEMFRMSGEHLCRLTEDEFRQRSPEAGMNLYAQLVVWKNACKLANPALTHQQTTVGDVYSSYSYDNSYIPPVPSSSPTPSVSSDDSSNCSVQFPEEDFSLYKPDSSRPRPVETHHKQTTHLWEFLKELLLKPESYSGCIKWLDRKNGIFKIEDSSKVARLWGMRKNRPAMNYDKLSRSIRQYYKKKIIKKTEHSKRLVYQFCQPFL